MKRTTTFGVIDIVSSESNIYYVEESAKHVGEKEEGGSESESDSGEEDDLDYDKLPSAEILIAI